MALLEKLTGEAQPKLPVHQFYSALIEFNAGETDKATIIAFFELDVSDVIDLDWLIGKFQASTNKREFAERIHGIFMLAEIGYTGFTTQSEIIAIINGIG